MKYFQRKSSIKDRNFTGFTLIELLIVIGIIAILAAAVIIAINPGQQFAQARDATRESHINALQNAILSYQVDNHGTLPAEVKDNPGAEICNLQALAEGESCPAGTIDLSPLVPEYISSLPINPSHEPTDPDIGYGIASVENEFTIWPTESETRLVGRRPALEFDGEDDYVDLDNTTIELNNGNLTFSAWVYFYEPTPVVDVLFSCYSPDGVAYIRRSNTRTMEYRYYDTNGDGRVLSLNWNIPDAVWKHVIFVIDANNNKIYGYENGSLVDEKIVGYDFSGINVMRYIGIYQPTLHPYPGILADVRVYNRALSAQEVENLYHGKNITNGLVGHWSLNEGQGCTAYDHSGNGNDGTLQPNCPDNNPEWVIGN